MLSRVSVPARGIRITTVRVHYSSLITSTGIRTPRRSWCFNSGLEPSDLGYSSRVDHVQANKHTDIPLSINLVVEMFVLFVIVIVNIVELHSREQSNDRVHRGPSR